MNLPKKCPKCGADLDNDDMYYAHGVQYCYGSVYSLNDNGTVTVDDLDGGDWTIDPYKIQCGECEHVLWQRHIIVNEEQFFVEEKDGKKSNN